MRSPASTKNVSRSRLAALSPKASANLPSFIKLRPLIRIRRGRRQAGVSIGRARLLITCQISTVVFRHFDKLKASVRKSDAHANLSCRQLESGAECERIKLSHSINGTEIA